MKKTTKVLIIDDEPLVSGLLTTLVEKRGCKTSTAPSVAAAKAWLEKNAPSAIFCDIMLPDGTGFELCRWIRGRDALKKTPLVLMTAIADEETAEDAAELGIFDYLRKPFDIEQLNGKLDRILPESAE